MSAEPTRPAECQSPATVGSIIQPQHQYLAEENARLTRELRHAIAAKVQNDIAASELLRLKDEEIADLRRRLDEHERAVVERSRSEDLHL